MLKRRLEPPGWAHSCTRAIITEVLQYDVSPLIGCTVTRVAFDYQVRLLLADGGYPHERVSAELVIETPITFIDAAGTNHQVRPGEVETVAPMLSLFQRRVVGASFGGHSLSMVFDDESVLQVATNESYESWNITGRGVDEFIEGPRA